MLDMHVESGQHALSVAGLTDEFRRRVLIGGDAMRVLDKAGLVRYRDDGDGKRPEIERGDLRTMLLESTPNDRIHWGTKIVDVSPLGDGRHKITTATRDSFTTDLLVGADGAWSKVRSIVSDAKPIYL
jgi:2-polyprenyl-6-methoxyphenol hydroxylase-like FAD-dependent oxidoreductase